jgi:hypothetical protein
MSTTPSSLISFFQHETSSKRKQEKEKREMRCVKSISRVASARQQRRDAARATKHTRCSARDRLMCTAGLLLWCWSPDRALSRVRHCGRALNHASRFSVATRGAPAGQRISGLHPMRRSIHRPMQPAPTCGNIYPAAFGSSQCAAPWPRDSDRYHHFICQFFRV